MSLQSVSVLVALARAMWLEVEFPRLKLAIKLVGKYQFHISQ